MFALVALMAFILSPFLGHVGPWPMLTVGFIFLTLHFLWDPWPLPWVRRSPPA